MADLTFRNSLKLATNYPSHIQTNILFVYEGTSDKIYFDMESGCLITKDPKLKNATVSDPQIKEYTDWAGGKGRRHLAKYLAPGQRNHVFNHH